MTTERWLITLTVVLDRDTSGDDPPQDWNWHEVMQLLPYEKVEKVQASIIGIERGH